MLACMAYWQIILQRRSERQARNARRRGSRGLRDCRLPVLQIAKLLGKKIMTSRHQAWATLQRRLKILDPLPFSSDYWSLVERMQANFNDREAHTHLPIPIARFRAARDYASASGDGRLSALAICGLGRALYAHGHEIDGRNLLLLGERLAMQTGDHLVLGKARDALRAVTRIATGPKLTKRETEVIRLVDKGESDRVIAGHLGIAVPTVRRHLENIFAKLNTRSRGAAAAIWRNLP